MPEVDFDALEKASKALSVIFITFILILNAVQIYFSARRVTFMYHPKSLLLISLAIGDIFLALFSLVVNARVVFEKSDISCRTTRTAQHYQSFIINFVYGVGIITLTAEFVIRNTRRRPLLQNCQMLEALIFSAIPWFLALVIVGPLTMAGMDWDSCLMLATPRRIQAMYGVSVIAPAIIAVIFCFVIMFINFRLGSTQGTVIASYVTGVSQQQLANGNSSTHSSQSNLSKSSNQSIRSSPQVHMHLPSFQGTYSDAFVNPAKEKRVLLAVALIHSVCVLPQAAFYISEGSVSYFTVIVLMHTFYWLSNFRSIVTPLIWAISFLD